MVKKVQLANSFINIGHSSFHLTEELLWNKLYLVFMFHASVWQKLWKILEHKNYSYKWWFLWLVVKKHTSLRANFSSWICNTFWFLKISASNQIKPKNKMIERIILVKIIYHTYLLLTTFPSHWSLQSWLLHLFFPSLFTNHFVTFAFSQTMAIKIKMFSIKCHPTYLARLCCMIHESNRLTAMSQSGQKWA